MGFYHPYYHNRNICFNIYILLPEQQLKWFFLTLILAATILFLIGMSVFYISKILSRLFLGGEQRHVDIIFAGTIIISLSQLFGPLFGASYPLILGPDASSYSLSFSSMYFNISYNDTSKNYTFTSTDISGLHYGPMKDNYSQKDGLIFIHTNISAANSNPLMKYEDQIFLDLILPANVTASISRPVIMVGQSSDVVIRLDNPNPGIYPIKLHGIGASGKTYDAMTVIGVSSEIEKRFYVPIGVYSIDKFIQLWGNSTCGAISIDWLPCINHTSNQPRAGVMTREEIISQIQGPYAKKARKS
ncbi:MAG: hypothetical protein ACP5PV_13025 [Methanothrix sp.]